MRKYYVITVLSAIAILCIQVNYIKNLYNRYLDEVIIETKDAMQLAVDEELRFRLLKMSGGQTNKEQYLEVESNSNYIIQDVDSVQLNSPLRTDKKYSIGDAQQKGVGKTTSELLSQVFQDMASDAGGTLDLQVLDSFFIEAMGDSLNHIIYFFNKDSAVVDSIGNWSRKFDYISELSPIGTQGLEYLQIKMRYPMSHFIKLHVWVLVLSLFFILLALFCLLHQLVVIRRKEKLLQKRENSINGTVHDLKAPLNSVLTTLGWLESGEGNAAKKKAIEISRAEVKHMVCNIESLLVTVRKDRKTLILKKEAIDILQLTEIVKSSMDALYRTKQHRIEIDNRLPEEVKVFADGMYIENVIRNLVENALKYSDDGVTVKIILSVADSMLLVAVQDNGWGIAPEYQNKLFHQFYQVPREEGKICKGYGIGLAQSKYIIDEHKGKITVKSAEGEGSVFTFFIPLA